MNGALNRVKRSITNGISAMGGTVSARNATSAEIRDLKESVWQAIRQGKPGEAATVAAGVMNSHAEADPLSEPYWTAWTLRTLAQASLGQHTTAVDQFSAMINALRTARAKPRWKILPSVVNRASQLLFLGKFDAAEMDLDLAIKEAGEIPFKDMSDANLYSALCIRVNLLNARGKFLEAEDAARSSLRAIDDKKRFPDYVRDMLRNGLAASLNAQGRHYEAVELLRDIALINPLVKCSVHRNLAVAKMGLSRLDEAADLARSAMLSGEQGLGQRHYMTLYAGTVFGTILAAQGRSGEAQRLLEENSAAWAESFGEDHPRTLAAYEQLAQVRQYRADSGKE